MPVEEVEELVRRVAQGILRLARQGSEFDLVAFDAADDEGLGGVPADLLVRGEQQSVECVDRVAVGLCCEEPVGLEERGDPAIGVAQGPGPDGSFGAADLGGDGFPGRSGNAEFGGPGKDGLGWGLRTGHDDTV